MTALAQVIQSWLTPAGCPVWRAGCVPPGQQAPWLVWSLTLLSRREAHLTVTGWFDQAEAALRLPDELLRTALPHGLVLYPRAGEPVLLLPGAVTLLREEALYGVQMELTVQLWHD